MNLRIAAIVVVSALFLSGCDNSSDSNGFSDSNIPRQLTILVTNDDGIGAPGIDSLVNTLTLMDNVEVVVVAPAENQSQSADKTTQGELVFEDSATTSGYLGTAVYGFPADAVNVALKQLEITPNLVVSGVNSGHNVGPIAPISGTVGAAQIAARAGFPAVAVSAGLTSDTDFDAAAELVIAWIENNRAALGDNSARADIVTSFNIPNCTQGNIRGLVEVPRADAYPAGTPNIFFTDCSVEPDGPPTSDLDAIIKGFASQTELPLDF